ncbi:MAG: peptidoglycan editing factor PgeF [Porticoccaceae bacterium]|nr:peptidoglycan editing factor PgeF [Porticoccaceae bacterium]
MGVKRTGAGPEFLIPDWPAPGGVRAAVSTRHGGVSAPPWSSLNLGSHVGDQPAAVADNRRLVAEALGLTRQPVWLEQVHGTQVLVLEGRVPVERIADAAVTREQGQVCAVLTADCLPVLLCDRAGTVVAAAHAGWRGLAAGVVRETVKAMGVAGEDIIAWLGPAIGPQRFEVGDEVREAMLSNAIDARHRQLIPACFAPVAKKSGKLMADIYALARAELSSLGVSDVHGGGLCTVSDRERWYSYRRDGETGRMTALIWLA